MKTRIKWVQDVMFVGETGTGHAIVMDGAPESGGRNLGARPMEMLLVGLGGCSAFDVVMILKRGRETITDCVVEIDAQRADSDPKVFTIITMHFIVTGKQLDPKKVARAITLSAEKYCSAVAMLGAVAKITHDFVMHDVDAPTVSV